MTVASTIQEHLDRLAIDGWLFVDFCHSDPLAYKVLQLNSKQHVSRRWAYYIPKVGLPRKIVHAIEQNTLNDLPGTVTTYIGWRDFQESLRKILPAKSAKVAMQYSPCGCIPAVSTVDGGTIDLVRSFGVEVVSSGDLISMTCGVLDTAQRDSHLSAACKLGDALDVGLNFIANNFKQVSELEVQKVILEACRERGLMSPHPPIVAFGPNTSLPHYSPNPSSNRSLTPGDIILIDLWGKSGESGVYADITWMACFRSAPLPEWERAFDAAVFAREATLIAIRSSLQHKEPIRGAELDDTCRRSISDSGFGDNIRHRTGHAIDTELHGVGTHLDNLETNDHRLLFPGALFSIEPGIYFPNNFGVRTEINVLLDTDDFACTGRPRQHRIICL